MDHLHPLTHGKASHSYCSLEHVSLGILLNIKGTIICILKLTYILLKLRHLLVHSSLQLRLYLASDVL